MPWLELRIDASEQQVTELEQSLINAGALAVTYADAGDQPILEPEVGTMPLWSEIQLVALFDAATNTTDAESTIFSDFNECSQNYRWNILEDRVWEREWLKHQQPVKFGNTFWVYHERVDSELPTLLLDPGLAFGTGSHPTTALCLEWAAHQTLPGKSIIDYGCGSGILAVAALLNGANSVVCVDIDPQALDATKNNAIRNNISAEKINVYFPGNEPNEKVDILFANILAGPLKQLATSLAGKVYPGGDICLSGILREQEQEILESYSHWFEDMDSVFSGDWVRIVGKRNAMPSHTRVPSET